MIEGKKKKRCDKEIIKKEESERSAEARKGKRRMEKLAE